MIETLSILLLALLGVLLLVAAVGDLRTRIIPNWLNASIALLALPWWLVSGFTLLPEITAQVALALGCFCIGAILFYLRAMGGGDVKMIAALVLWIPPHQLANFLVVMAFAGGALTVLMMVGSWLRRSKARLKIPYGIAIAAGAVSVFAEPFLNHFA